MSTPSYEQLEAENKALHTRLTQLEQQLAECKLLSTPAAADVLSVGQAKATGAGIEHKQSLGGVLDRQELALALSRSVNECMSRDLVTIIIDYLDPHVPITPITKFRLVRSFGGFGKDKGCLNFNGLLGVAVPPKQDLILVADAGNSRIQIFDLEGNFIRSFHARGGDTLRGPCSISMFETPQHEHRIVVLDGGDDQPVHVFDDAGRYQFSFGHDSQQRALGLDEPLELAVNGKREVIVTDASKKKRNVQVFDGCSGRFRRVFDPIPVGKAIAGSARSKPPSPGGVCVDTFRGKERVLVSDADNHRIVVFDSDGHYVEEWKDDEHLVSPASLAVDRVTHFVYVIDSAHSRTVMVVRVFDPQGRYVCSFGGDSPTETVVVRNPMGIAVSSTGQIIVGDASTHTINIIEPTP